MGGAENDGVAVEAFIAAQGILVSLWRVIWLPTFSTLWPY